MYPIIWLILFLLMMNNPKVYSQQLVEDRKILLIDAGHGGVDSGTVSEDGLQEKEVVLDIALNMVAWNKGLLESKYDIYLTRTRDTLISLSDRIRLAKHLKPDVLISLHCNHIDDSNIQGVEIYTYDNNELSGMYAKAILNELNRHLGFKIKEPKLANFQVLRETKEYCPAVLIELGYLSNSDESKYLKNFDNRKALTLAILMAI